MCKVKSLLGLWASTNPLAKIRKNGKRKAENGKLFCFSVFAWSGKRNAAIKPRAEGKFICTMPRRSSEARRATDAAEREQRANLFALCRGGAVKPEGQPTLRSERRGQIYLHYAEPRGGKVHEEGLKRKTESGKRKTDDAERGGKVHEEGLKRKAENFLSVQKYLLFLYCGIEVARGCEPLCTIYKL